MHGRPVQMQNDGDDVERPRPEQEYQDGHYAGEEPLVPGAVEG
jgi:hypothetical protein